MDIRNFIKDYLLVIFLVNIPYGLMQDDDYEDAPSFGRCPWIRNKLKNGRVRYRYKGRVAKFLCDSGYELAGKRSSTCVRGQWSNPLPVCVARGCSRIPPILNGGVTEMYRGAFLVYDCNPGYTLAGETSLHCDGRRWNSTSPVCVVSTPDPETQCDFESPDLCGWSHDPTNDFDWKRNQFSTPSGHVGTGPSYDHTFGENKAGYYLYMETSSPRRNRDKARLYSPVYPSSLSGGCFIFWYHMYGATTGSLRVFYKQQAHHLGELRPKFEKVGNQGNQWFRGNFDVPLSPENFQIIIEGIRGESYVGDSAIDDVQLTKLDCASMENVTQEENTLPESCRGRCRGSDTTASCGCNENCFAADNCCSDYLTLCSEGNETTAQNTDETLPADYYAKTTSPVTVTINETSLKPTEEQTLTALTNMTSQSTSQASTAAAPSTSIPVPSSTVTVSVLPLSPTTVAISSTKSSTPATQSTTTQSSTTPTKTETVVSTSSISTTVTDNPKPDTTVASTTPKTTKIIVTSASTESLKTSSSTKPTMTTTTSSTSSVETTSTEKTSKLPVVTTATSTTTTTTTPKTTSTTTTSTTPVSTSTTTASTTSLSTSTTTTSTTQMSTSMSTMSPTDSTTVSKTLPIPVTEPESSSTSRLTSTETTSSSTSSTIPPTTTPRYNLRPRKTTTSVPTGLYSDSTTATSITTSTAVSTPFLPTASTTSATRRWLNFTVFSTSTTSTVGRTTKITTTNAPPKTSTTIRNQPNTTKFTFFTSKPTPYNFQSTVPTTSDSYEMIPSKAETPKSSNQSVIVIVLVVIVIVCVAGGVAFYLRKYKTKRQSKLGDDSEMRFLPESDFMEYSDASALDKILVT